MDFLDNSVLPQSAHHMVLLKYILVLTFILFIPYLSILVGSTLLSVFYNRKGRLGSNKMLLKYAKELINLVTVNKSMAFGLGFVPLLSAIFCYAQLLHQSGANVSQFLAITLFFFIVGAVFVYAYKYSFHLKDVLSSIDDSNEEAVNLRSEATQVYNKAGKYGLLFLLIASYLFVGAMELAIDPARWATADLLGIIFSWNTIIYFEYFLAFSLAVTFGYVLFVFFRPNSDKKNEDADYLDFVKKSALRKGLAFTIIIPFISAINLIITPQAALSGLAFVATIFVLLLLLIIAVLFYMMLRDSNARYSTSVIYLFFLFFVFLVIRNHAAFDTSTKEQFSKLAANYEVFENEMKEKLGIATVDLSGEDIFNGRCAACHKFDQKLVGPAYNAVLPKYEGKRDDLVKFVLNPVKVDPAYPPMPNQGLKPNEAGAIADYLMKMYEENK